MPELCEVQIMTENIGEWSVGKTLKNLDLVDKKLSGKIENPALANGQTVQKAWRRAKYTVLTLDTHSLVLHYRMTGKVVLEDEGRRFIRLRLIFEDDTRIVFSDPRRFGEAELIKNEALTSYFQAKNLGDEPWEEGASARSGSWWQSRLGVLNNPIKPAMLRQDKVVGLGNILAAEICFRAKLDPAMKASTVSLEQWERVAISAQSCIEEILHEERSEEIGYVNQGNELPSSFKVYGRNGDPCSACGTKIESFTQQSRTTYWCPSCQAG